MDVRGLHVLLSLEPALDVNIAHFFSCEEGIVLQDHIVGVPDDHAQFVADDDDDDGGDDDDDDDGDDDDGDDDGDDGGGGDGDDDGDDEVSSGDGDNVGELMVMAMVTSLASWGKCPQEGQELACRWGTYRSTFPACPG